MSRAYFTTENGIVNVRMRVESNGAVADIVADIVEGQEFASVKYADMVRVGAGKIAFDDNGHGAIVV